MRAACARIVQGVRDALYQVLYVKYSKGGVVVLPFYCKKINKYKNTTKVPTL